MRNATVSLIAAMTPGRVIGKDGKIPWTVKSDTRAFRSITWGCPLIMGSTTFFSTLRQHMPLPGRTSIVITHNHVDAVAEAGGIPVDSPEAALRVAATQQGTYHFIIGGERVFRDFLPLARALFLTTVHTEVAGDTFFPPFDLSGWHLAESKPRRMADPDDEFETESAVYTR